MNKRVVVIDDDTDIIELIRYVLVDEGYDVVGFTHLEPVKKIILLLPSVVLLDIMLGDEYGDTLCKLIKLNPASKQIPVILVSAVPNLADIAKQCQADAFLPKPVNLDNLVKLVKHYSEGYNAALTRTNQHR
jgi:DNA-binding response OmpR family regulator